MPSPEGPAPTSPPAGLDGPALALYEALRDEQQWLDPEQAAGFAYFAVRVVEARVRAEYEDRMRRLADYENAILWNVTCTGCARQLDKLIAEREAGYREGRREAAAAIQAHADKHVPKNGNEAQRQLRRHLMIGARVAAGPPTDQEIVEAIRAGNYAVCHLDEAGRSIRPEHARTEEDR